MRLIVLASMLTLACSPDYEALHADVEAVLREGNDLLAAESVDATSLVPVLEALEAGKVDCARCLLESKLDEEVAKAERILRERPSEITRGWLEPELEAAASYRERFPWQAVSCEKEVCAFRE